MSITKSDLINNLSHKTPSDQEETVGKAVNVMLEQIRGALNEGQRIEIRGFGSFSIRQWGARYARNPVTGESWRTDPSRAVHFKPGKELKERVRPEDKE